MFDERRQTTVKGIDRSYPLEPLDNNKLRRQATNGATTAQRNGNVTVSRQSVGVKRVARADVNSNVNGGKPVVSYHEEVTRESFGPSVHRRDDDEDEFGTFANGHYRHHFDDDEVGVARARNHSLLVFLIPCLIDNERLRFVLRNAEANP